MKSKFPHYISQLFWGDDLSQLDWTKHQAYITQTILEKGNSAAAKWLLKKSKPKLIKDQLSTLKLSHKSRNFWKLYLS